MAWRQIGTRPSVSTMPIRLTLQCRMNDIALCTQHKCRGTTINETVLARGGKVDSASGTYSISHKTSYRKISQVSRSRDRMLIYSILLWSLAGASAIVLSRSLPNFRAIGFFFYGRMHLLAMITRYKTHSYQCIRRAANCVNALAPERCD